MKNKITLITPPDYYENYNRSILFICVNEQDQEKITKWFSNSSYDQDLNVYFYSGEDQMEWLLWSVARANHTFIDLDTDSYITKAISGYLVSRPNVYMQTHNEQTARIFSYINANQVPDIDFFLEEVFNK